MNEKEKNKTELIGVLDGPVDPFISYNNDKVDLYISERLTKLQLSDLRKIKHLTQKDMSMITGLSIQCISDIESKNSGNPTLKSLIKYLDVLGYEICFKRNKESDKGV